MGHQIFTADPDEKIKVEPQLQKQKELFLQLRRKTDHTVAINPSMPPAFNSPLSCSPILTSPLKINFISFKNYYFSKIEPDRFFSRRLRAVGKCVVCKRSRK